MIEVRETVPVDDLPHIARNLRPADTQELLAASGLDPFTGLVMSSSLSQISHTVLMDGSPEVVFGVRTDPDTPSFGWVWLMGTERLFQEQPRTFIRLSRTYLDMLHEEYSMLGNQVDCRNTVHVNWLRWLGFSFIRRIEAFGVQQLPFYEFAHHVCPPSSRRSRAGEVRHRSPER